MTLRETTNFRSGVFEAALSLRSGTSMRLRNTTMASVPATMGSRRTETLTPPTRKSACVTTAGSSSDEDAEESEDSDEYEDDDGPIRKSAQFATRHFPSRKR